MNEPNRDLASLGSDNAIRLRWALRDIRGQRVKFSSVDPNDIRILVEMGYIGVIHDELVITMAGLQQIGE
jgi:hypothetical protein